jgi:hypothetical protein
MISSTEIHNLYTKIHQPNEIEILITEAEKGDINIELFDALCRAISVLQVSHLEGFMKDFLKALIRDLNQHLDFVDMPIGIKTTYVKSFCLKDGNGKYNQKQIERLKSKFIEFPIQIESEPFFYHKENKNPNSKLVHTIFENLGIKNLFSYIKDSKVDVVFEDDQNATDDIIKKLNTQIEAGVNAFPYTTDLNEFDFNKSDINDSTKTIYEEFLDEVNGLRHKIVHGNIIENQSSIHEIKRINQNILIFKLSVILIGTAVITEKIGST